MIAKPRPLKGNDSELSHKPMADFDLNAYFARIGYDGPVRVDFETLAGIQFAHTCSIPFEHIDVLDDRGISLEPDAIFDKLVTRRRGGYCFEQNNLLLSALRQIGFEVKPLAARVRLGAPRDYMPPRTHIFVKVVLDGEDWIVDSGIGGFSQTAPLRWIVDAEQETPHDRRRFVVEDGRYFHQVWNGEAWFDLCEFTGEESHPMDQAVGNWWTSTNPNARFRTGLAIGLARRDGTRYAILNDRFTHRRNTEILEQRQIESKADLLSVLKDKFGLVVPERTSFGQWPF